MPPRVTVWPLEFVVVWPPITVVLFAMVPLTPMVEEETPVMFDPPLPRRYVWTGVGREANQAGVEPAESSEATSCSAERELVR